MIARAVLLCVLLMTIPPVLAGEYQDDPAIIAILDALGERTSAVLPALVSDCGSETLYGCATHGPAGRDYCNKLAYTPDRGTALYAGGSHQTLRSNDVWELHLGSNTWHMIFAPDGGNHALLKGSLYFHAVPKLKKDPNVVLPEKEQAEFEAAKVWWNKNAVFKDGHVVTRNGGPIMPVHTWDAITYDPRVGRLLWTLGAGPGSEAGYHGIMAGVPEVEGDASYTNMWTFDPKGRQWQHYRTDKKHPGFRGMGATLCYIPELKKSIYYVAAQNVSPHDFEMWTYDAVADHWEELRPNGGRSISDLATREDLAPDAELQSAYSAKHQAMVSVLGPDAYAYDIVKNEWSKLCHDPRLNAHDASTTFAYDSHADVFLLADPRNKKAPLAAFSLTTKQWEIIEPAGAGFLKSTEGNPRGYYDPEHNVFVVHGGDTKHIWVYRHGKTRAR